MAKVEWYRRVSVVTQCSPLRIKESQVGNIYTVAIELPLPGDGTKSITIDRFVCSSAIVDDLWVKLTIDRLHRTHGFVKAPLLERIALGSMWDSGMAPVELCIRAERAMDVDCGLVCSVRTLVQ